MNGRDGYFFFEQVGQVAQVALLSVQHFIPQAAVAASFSQQALLPAQPTSKPAAQTVTARSFSAFIRVIFGFGNCRPGSFAEIHAVQCDARIITGRGKLSIRQILG